jgi:hypothetical protein
MKMSESKTFTAKPSNLWTLTADPNLQPYSPSSGQPSIYPQQQSIPFKPIVPWQTSQPLPYHKTPQSFPSALPFNPGVFGPRHLPGTPLEMQVENDVLYIGNVAISFMRTLRIPDDGKNYPLPPGLGLFPLRKIEDYLDTVPESWQGEQGVFMPMYQREAQGNF